MVSCMTKYKKKPATVVICCQLAVTLKNHVTIHSNIHVNFGFIFRGQRHSQGESRGCKGEGFRRSGEQTYFWIFTTSYFQICCRA